MYDALVAAINGRRLITLWYPPGARVVEPHALGTASNGQLLLRAFQIEGASESGEHVNWKLFRLDRMRDVDSNDQKFAGPRSEYKQNDRAMTRGIIAQL